MSPVSNSWNDSEVGQELWFSAPMQAQGRQVHSHRKASVRKRKDLGPCCPHRPVSFPVSVTLTPVPESGEKFTPSTNFPSSLWPEWRTRPGGLSLLCGPVLFGCVGAEEGLRAGFPDAPPPGPAGGVCRSGHPCGMHRRQPAVPPRQSSATREAGWKSLGAQGLHPLVPKWIC